MSGPPPFARRGMFVAAPFPKVGDPEVIWCVTKVRTLSTGAARVTLLRASEYATIESTATWPIGGHVPAPFRVVEPRA